ncbi:hypothetical protein N185_17630 [Sinorhizobium sp. GW3]|nr:hypothetical protein N185_17630 [Sinorhizobium sp. GW3]
MDRLNELEVFLAILDCGTLAAAARRLRRSPPAVTRILNQLEERLGIALIERTTRRCIATEPGRQLAESSRQLLANYKDAMAEAAGEATIIRGTIRVTAPLVFGREYISPLITDFLRSYQNVVVDLNLADRIVDLHEENMDLALRIGPITDSTLVARRVGQVSHVVVASPSYLAEHGAPVQPEDIVSHSVIQHTSLGVSAPWLLRDKSGNRTSVNISARFAVNHADAAIAAARNGGGLVRALSYQVDNDLRRGSLVRVLAPFEPEPLPVSLVRPESRRAIRRIRLLSDHLAAHLSKLPVMQPLTNVP